MFSSTSFSATSGVRCARALENIGGTASEERDTPMKRIETVAVTPATHAELGHAIASGWKRVLRWYKARLTYRELSRLDDRALKDIGVYRPDLNQHLRRQ
jgi:uncharacterized protein YjiS (DUF1127 family)